MTIKTYKVKIIESERGWGQRIDYRLFDTEKEALDFIEDMNKDEDFDASTPDWYMIANKCW